MWGVLLSDPCWSPKKREDIRAHPIFKGIDDVEPLKIDDSDTTECGHKVERDAR